MAKPATETIDNICSSDAPCSTQSMVRIPGGTFVMGSDHHYPEEKPSHKVRVRGFWIDPHTVTNAEFKRFIDATDYVTCAERPANPADYPGALAEMLEPSSVTFAKPPHRVDLRNHYNWWVYTRGANWRHPRGPGSSPDGLMDHPVVHVAFEDAAAYAHWASWYSAQRARSGKLNEAS